MFPDQIKQCNTYADFFRQMQPLKNQQVFVDTLKAYDKALPICVFGDYDSSLKDIDRLYLREKESHLTPRGVLMTA